MAASDARFRARPGLVVSGKDDARYLTDTQSGQVYEMNGTALAIFEAAQRGEPEAAIVDALCADFPDVPREEIERDAREMLAAFVAAGVLQAI